MEHPFSQYIKILGKGKLGARDMTVDEAYQAMSMILSGQVEPVQLGAFLMLLRVKEETPSEVAGFVRASRESLSGVFPETDLDYPCYAGKRRQLPWFVLAALLLSSHGISVLMHGIGGKDRVYAPDALRALGIKESSSLVDAAQNLQKNRFAFLPLEALSPELSAIMKLRPLLGLRSPVHTIVKMLNPFAASASLQGIFHPGYLEIHQKAAMLLKEESVAVFKGEGGEAERNPDIPCLVKYAANGGGTEEEWEAAFESRHMKDETMNVLRLKEVWEGKVDDEYARETVLSTAAVALKALGHASGRKEAEKMARDLWECRDVSYIGKLN